MSSPSHEKTAEAREITPETDPVAEEQAVVTMLYGHLDKLREQADERLAAALRQTGGTQQERSQRESTVLMHTEQQAQYSAVESGLVFGRLDLAAPDDADPISSTRHIGRIGIFDEEHDFEPLLLDWRAPAARPFYLATAAAPDGVRRRRHIRTHERDVIGVDDEVLDLAEAAQGDQHPHESLTGEAVLLAALGAKRTGRMKDIVETIQAEQDQIIRADLSGVLVVQGGPGTGKTAVALHRAAYLLYTHRRELSSRGVLVVGPNATFLRYIAHVLPSLAETGVLLRTQADLFPGVHAGHEEPDAVAEIKGRAVLADVLAQAVRDRQRVPDDYLEIVIDQDSLRRTVLRLDRAVAEDARAAARSSGKPHNLARETFDAEVIHALSMQLAEEIGTDPFADDPLGGNDAPGDPLLLEEADLAEFRRELREEPGVQAALDWCWPILSPQRLVGDLLGSAERLATAAAKLPVEERAKLHRSRGDAWTPADVPLLDEAAELLGDDDRDARALAERTRRQLDAYAAGALQILHGSRSIDLEDEIDPELLTAADLLDAARLGGRQEEVDRRTAAERAAADRRWAYGHIIVDEAQELSPMAWRLLMRRCPSRSMTVVGDVAQTGVIGGATSWQDVLGAYVADRWRLTELTVNYRTPSEIMALASGVLAAIDPAMPVPRSVRDSGEQPWLATVDPDTLIAELTRAVATEAKLVDGGRVGVLVPATRLPAWGGAIAEAVPGAAVGDESDLDSDVVVLSVRQAKGLEFDTVIVADPAGLVAESVRGLSDLYVALTRSTNRLGVLSPGPLPAELR
ncbi:DNA helicase IV [Hamadaea flava]|nr:DNA helicase IV [Hamadaea flava]